VTYDQKGENQTPFPKMAAVVQNARIFILNMFFLGASITYLQSFPLRGLLPGK